jgi:catechol 2,3-dioxygenase-like lactoylglutathione lyase family enzyme
MGLSDYRYGGTIPVEDMAKAKEFYAGTLGLSGGEEVSDGGITYSCGEGSTVHVFPSPGNAGKTAATLGGWNVEDIDSVVTELSSNGVTFEQIDQGPIETDEKGIATLGDSKIAWFKDPDGNTLGLIQG